MRTLSAPSRTSLARIGTTRMTRLVLPQVRNALNRVEVRSGGKHDRPPLVRGRAGDADPERMRGALVASSIRVPCVAGRTTRPPARRTGRRRHASVPRAAQPRGRSPRDVLEVERRVHDLGRARQEREVRTASSISAVARLAHRQSSVLRTTAPSTGTTMVSPKLDHPTRTSRRRIVGATRCPRGAPAGGAARARSRGAGPHHEQATSTDLRIRVGRSPSRAPRVEPACRSVATGRRRSRPPSRSSRSDASAARAHASRPPGPRPQLRIAGTPTNTSTTGAAPRRTPRAREGCGARSSRQPRLRVSTAAPSCP